MSSELVTITNPKSPIAEAYRTLRTNIQFSNVDEDLKVICVDLRMGEEHILKQVIIGR